MPTLDHLVLASPDPPATLNLIAARTGVTLTAGGAHVGRGTRNWLGRLGEDQYLELIGVDPDQPQPSGPRPFGVDDLTEATLVAWCARHDDLDGLRARAGADGIELAAPVMMERDAPTGLLRWRLSLPEFDTAGGIVPFFIDWRGSVHPSETSVGGLTLVDFGAEHPAPPSVRVTLDVLGVELRVREGPTARLQATLRGPAGELRLG